MYSKKVKLPKKQWQKGKSKFLHMRREEEKRAARKAALPQLTKEKSFMEKLISFIKKLYARCRIFTKTVSG